MDPNIDPALQQSVSDPTLAFINGLNFHATEDAANSDVEDDFPLPAHLTTSTSNGSSSRNGVAHFTSLIKQNVKLSGESEADFDAFCSAASLEERLAMLFASVLENRDLLKQSQKAEHFEVSKGLQKTTRSYMYSFLLSPTTSSYRGNVADHILKAMRDLKVQDLPPEKEVTQVKTVLGMIGKLLTTGRNVIKDKIKASLEPGSSTRNIADLTQALVSSTPVKATAQHYVRFAFLRWQLVQYPDLEDDWWPTVDKNLTTFRNLGDAAKINMAFNDVYKQDVTTFGDPANTGHVVTEPRDVVAWIKTVNDHAAHVQGQTVTRGSKRRRVEG